MDPQFRASYVPSVQDDSLNRNQSDSPAQLDDAEKIARSRGIFGRALLLGGLIMLFVFGMLTALVTFLCVANQCTRPSSRVLQSTASLGKVLTISQVASHVVPLTIPLLMGVWAYRLGAQWLQSSVTLDNNRPSPLQLGLLMSICNAANLPAFLRSLKFAFKLDKTTKKQDLPMPRILRHSLVLLFYLLFLSYTVAGADAWFHATSKAVEIQMTKPFIPGSLVTDFGREINSTTCDLAAQSSTGGPIYQGTCGLINGLAVHDRTAVGLGQRVVVNASEHRVVFADDQTAILVPSSTPANLTFTAKTVGFKASCRSITSECLVPEVHPNFVSYGSGAALNLACRGKHAFNISQANGNIRGPLDADGNIIYGHELPSNPFNVAAVVTSLVYSRSDSDTFINNTGWFVHGNSGAWNVIYCGMTAVDVVYRYSSRQYRLLSFSPVSLQSTRYMAAVGFSVPNTLVSVGSAVDGVSIETWGGAFQRELSRQILGYGAMLYRTQNAIELNWDMTIIGSKLDIIPFILLLGGMTAYGFVVLVVLLQTALTASWIPYVRLAALYLTDPLVTVHALYGPVKPPSTWQDDALVRFAREEEGDRLCMGPIATGVQTGSVFGVAKPSKSYRQNL